MMRASPVELHVDDKEWHPEQPTGEGGRGASPDEGEVTIALEEAASRSWSGAPPGIITKNEL